jgi:2-polyprenyl-6-methoxyphenol hydroxylase-like FAD-dependent oxidoreductase
MATTQKQTMQTPATQAQTLQEHTTEVLIVGAGPVGLSAAIELGFRQVQTLVVTDQPTTAQHPKCNTTNSRSMEHFRRLGIHESLRQAGLPAHVQRASAYVTRFCGEEFARMPRPVSNWPTPELPNHISQITLEKELCHHAQSLMGSGIRFGHRLVSFEDLGDGHHRPIQALIQNPEGQTYRVHARFLIGADGANSLVRKAIGAQLQGEDGSLERSFMGGTMLSYYIRAPHLQERSARVPAHSNWIINPKMRGLMFAQDGQERWVLHYQVPPGVDWRALDAREVVRSLLSNDDAMSNHPDLDFEILSGGPWRGGLALVADRYQRGNVFLVGDAAHLFTPLGGMGMNTGIGDVMNLCWKLDAAIKGWAGAGLVESFEIERRPMGLRNAAFGVQCAAVMDGWQVPRDFEEDTKEALESRSLLGAQILKEDAAQYLTVGLQLGERYESSTVVMKDSSPPPPDHWDTVSTVLRAGARAPHVWLSPGVSCFDRFGSGFTLINQGQPDVAKFLEEQARQLGLPLMTLSMEDLMPETAPPMTEMPQSSFKDHYTSTLILIRPDQHVAWHGEPREVNTLALANRLWSLVRGEHSTPSDAFPLVFPSTPTAIPRSMGMNS